MRSASFFATASATDFFARAGLADRTGVLAAMARVDRDHDVALAVAAPTLTGRGRLVEREIDDQAMPVGFVGRRQETLRLHFSVDVEHDAQPAAVARAQAHRADVAGAGRQAQCRDIARDLFEIDDDAIGAVEREQGIASRAPTGRARCESNRGSPRVGCPAA